MENKEKVYLKGMTEFVLEQTKFIKTADFRTSHIPLNNLHNYANFLKQPLCISQFVACKLVDGVWIVMNEPLKRNYNNVNINNSYFKEYQEAKQRVLFEGFEVKEYQYNKNMHSKHISNGFLSVFWDMIFEKKWGLSKGLSTIEDLTKYNLELSQTAVTQLNL
jgi:hypothetical protein